MSEVVTDALVEYAGKVKLMHTSVGWGIFTILVVFPLIMAASMVIDFVLLDIYLVLILAFMGLAFGLGFLASRLKFGFWIDPEVTRQFKLAYRTVYLVFSGAIICSVLIFLFLWWVFTYHFGYAPPDFWEDFSALTVFTIFLVGTLLILYLVFRYAEKKHENERWRFRFVRNKKHDVKKIVEKALDSLHLEYAKVEEGSKWTGLEPAYRIEGHSLSVRLSKRGMNEWVLTTIARTPEDVPKTREIEKSIGSFLKIMVPE